MKRSQHLATGFTHGKSNDRNPPNERHGERQPARGADGREPERLELQHRDDAPGTHAHREQHAELARGFEHQHHEAVDDAEGHQERQQTVEDPTADPVEVDGLLELRDEGRPFENHAVVRRRTAQPRRDGGDGVDIAATRDDGVGRIPEGKRVTHRNDRHLQHCPVAPDIYGSAVVYTPDELDAVVDEEGNAISEATPVAEPHAVSMSYDEAKQVIVKTSQGEKFIGQLSVDQLNAVIEKMHDARAIEAAKVVLAADAGMEPATE